MNLRSACLIAALSLCAAAAASAQQLPPDLDATSRARLPYLQRKDTDESAKRLFDIFVRNSNSPTDELRGPLAFAAYNAPVATALLDLHDGAVGKSSSLDAHVRELAILVACRATNNFGSMGTGRRGPRGVDQGHRRRRTNGATGLPTPTPP
jgi:hypothetical protein